MVQTFVVKFKTPVQDPPQSSQNSESVPPERQQKESNLAVPDFPLTVVHRDVEDVTAALDARSLLEKKKFKLSVTDFSAQLWCERQLELTLLTGRRRETAAMRAGTERHEKLEKEDHELVEVEVDNPEESLALRLVNSVRLVDHLMATGKARELWVFGITGDGILIRGVIDEMVLVPSGRRNTKELLLVDTKTRRQATEPSGAQKRTSAMQLSIYHWIVSDLQRGAANFEELFRIFKVDPIKPFTCEHLNEFVDLREVCAAFSAAFQRLPTLKSSMQIAYECDGQEFARNDIDYKEEAFSYAISDLLGWWQGMRPTEVAMACEKWKCKMCDFVGRECQQTPLSAPEVEELLSHKAVEEEAEDLIAAADEASNKREQQEKLSVHNTAIAHPPTAAEASSVEWLLNMDDNDNTTSEQQPSTSQHHAAVIGASAAKSAHLSVHTTGTGESPTVRPHRRRLTHGRSQLAELRAIGDDDQLIELPIYKTPPPPPPTAAEVSPPMVSCTRRLPGLCGQSLVVAGGRGGVSRAPRTAPPLQLGSVSGRSSSSCSLLDVCEGPPAGGRQQRSGSMHQIGARPVCRGTAATAVGGRRRKSQTAEMGGGRKVAAGSSSFIRKERGSEACTPDEMEIRPRGKSGGGARQQTLSAFFSTRAV